MLTVENVSLQAEQRHLLWLAITADLTATPGVFDAHGVCATVAQHVAVYAKTRAVAGINDPQHEYYDVWICEPNGSMRQERWPARKALFDPFLESGRGIRLSKFDRPPEELIRSEIWQLAHGEIVTVPLPYPGSSQPFAPPGILCLIDPDSDCCLDESSLEPLASNITVYLDRAYLRSQVNRQEVEFRVVSDLSYDLTSTLSLQAIYSQLMDPIKRTLNVESLSVGLIDPTSGDIQFVNLLMGPLFQDLPEIRIKKGQGIAGWVAENRQSVVINDVYSDERFYSNVDRRSGFHTKSMICIPLQVEERTIGILQAINKQIGEFNDNDLRLLLAIGGPLAAAIENAQLHGEVIAEKRRIETIFASMSEGTLVINAEGLITHTNEAFLSLLRKESEDLLGAIANDLIRLRTGTLDEFVQALLAAESGGKEYPSQANDLIQDGESFVPVLLSGAPAKNEHDRITEIILVFSDLTPIREVERMRDDFFHGIVHELRTPLASILMYARMLRSGKAQEKEKADRFLGVIERESDRLQEMVRQMLRLVKLEARELQRSLEPVDLNAIFDEMIPTMADQATEKGLIFQQQIVDSLPTVLGSQETYYLIFKNLLENAVKFTPSGKVHFKAWAEDGQVIVEVKDEGIGIPQQALPNLFKRFYRAQTAVERGIAGTGLGLYMVKESVENYRGTIAVESPPGAGTTFTVRLPSSDSPSLQ